MSRPSGNGSEKGSSRSGDTDHRSSGVALGQTLATAHVGPHLLFELLDRGELDLLADEVNQFQFERLPVEITIEAQQVRFNLPLGFVEGGQSPDAHAGGVGLPATSE